MWWLLRGARILVTEFGDAGNLTLDQKRSAPVWYGSTVGTLEK